MWLWGKFGQFLIFDYRHLKWFYRPASRVGRLFIFVKIGWLVSDSITKCDFGFAPAAATVHRDLWWELNMEWNFLNIYFIVILTIYSRGGGFIYRYIKSKTLDIRIDSLIASLWCDHISNYIFMLLFAKQLFHDNALVCTCFFTWVSYRHTSIPYLTSERVFRVGEQNFPW